MYASISRRGPQPGAPIGRISGVGPGIRCGAWNDPACGVRLRFPSMQAMKALVFSAAFVLLFVPQAHAQQLKLDIRDGRVSLDAQNVPVRQILAEWARV